MANQTRKPIEIDLAGIEIEGIKLFVQEGAGDPAAMSVGPLPPCVFPCIPCAHCTSAPSVSAQS